MNRKKQNQSKQIAAHLAAHERKVKRKTQARNTRAMRNKKRGLAAAIRRMEVYQ